MGRHPWLAPQDQASPLGDLAFLRHSYGVRDYLADSFGQGIVATVHVEALWDRARDPVEETMWLDTLPLENGIALRCVAFAPLASPDAPALIEAQAANPRVAGLRETIRWHPDPARRWTEEGITDDPAWRRGLAYLDRHGLLLELLMNPFQAEAVARLAADFPNQRLVVNHCCTPLDRDVEGLARWQQGLTLLGSVPNVWIKLSNFVAYTDDRTAAGARAVLMPCIEAFGVDRCLWGSDYPVARRTLPFAAMCDLFREAIRPFSPSEQRRLLHDNAAGLYGLPQGDAA